MDYEKFQEIKKYVAITPLYDLYDGFELLWKENQSLEKEIEILREATTSAYEAFQDQWNEETDADKKEYFAELEKEMLQALKQADKLKGK